MSKIPKCRLETYWANKEVFTCPKSQNVVWKPTGLTKRTFLFYGPMAPGAHRAHIFLIDAFIYFVNIYLHLIVLPIGLPIVLPIVLPIGLPIVLCPLCHCVLPPLCQSDPRQMNQAGPASPAP